jgi:hypothetical protein
MRTKAKSGTSRIITWLRDAWNETDHANRRMIELRTGILE